MASIMNISYKTPHELHFSGGALHMNNYLVFIAILFPAKLESNEF